VHFTLGFIDTIFQLSRDPALFDPLLSVGLEWMNVLPVHQPSTVVRPRIQVDPAVLNKTARLDKIGVLSLALGSDEEMNATADWQLAQAYTHQGYTAPAAFFLDRARATDEGITAILEASVAPAPSVTLAECASASPVANVGEQPGLTDRTAAAQQASAFAAGKGLSQVDLPAFVSFASVPEILPIVPPSAMPTNLTENRSLGMMIGNVVQSFSWETGSAPPLGQIKDAVYSSRVSAVDLSGLFHSAVNPSDIAVDLPHDYYYVVPLGLAECYHALGDFPNAEIHFFEAASYQFLNAAIEAPYLWQRLATLYLDWGDALFRADQVADALPIYQRVLMVDDTVPTSTLYTTASLQPGADPARAVIANLAAILATPSTVATLGINPVTASLIAEVRQQLIKIQGGLDFWGQSQASVPIWTFEYLQSVATNFAQLAISAERDVINFWDRSDQAAMTRLQIAQGADQAGEEFRTAQLQEAAATAESVAYAEAQDNAALRAANARANAIEYGSTSASAIVYQAASSQLSGGDDANMQQLNDDADQLMGTAKVRRVDLQGNITNNLRGSAATLSAAGQLVSSRLNRQYEVDSLKRQADDLDNAAKQAKAETAAAAARASAASNAAFAAEMRAIDARDTLKAFDNLTFSPDVWARMGNTMFRLYTRYLAMAVRAALLMQQAYNFETDQSLSLIRRDYTTTSDLKGLMGADMLMADIQGFTYDLITSRMGKPQPIRQTISLAERHGFAFENQLRKTGSMEFQTTFDDFDGLYPGTFAGRIDSVEVDIDGIVPVNGISGTLTNDGISLYRTPSTVATTGGTGVKYRVQSKETLVLSDYIPQRDALLFAADQRMSRIFQGAGVVSTWRLDLPKAVNDIDYGALVDVRLTFYYKARYDPDLRASVLADLAARPSAQARQQGIPLRWVYPDAFFHFQDTGVLAITLAPADFRHNETKPVLTSVGILVATDDTVPAVGLKVSLATPSHPSIPSQTDADGAISSDIPASGWGPLAAGSALGNYQITMTAADNPTLVANGKLALGPIVNIALILGFNYTARS
jgi:Tc toxin complex TcA C-terminal TcB-binding domain